MASDNSSITGRSLFVWLAVTGLAGAATFGNATQATETNTLFLLGFLLAGAVVVTRTLAGRATDLSTVLLVLWAASFGFWAPHWFGVVQVASAQWLTGPGHVSEEMGAKLLLPLTIATAGIATAALMRVVCTSPAVVALTVLSSLGCAGLLFAPIPEKYAVAGAAVLWHSMVTAGLCQWASESIARKKAGHCPHCGIDVAGLASPVCPHCDRPLAKAPMMRPVVAGVVRSGGLG